MPPHDLFDRIVEACELSEVIGPGLVRRSLADGGVDVDTATVTDWWAVLPQLEKRMRAYVSEAEAAERRRRVEALLRAEGATSEPPAAMVPPGAASDAGVSTPNPDA